MIELWSWPVPAGQQVHILLEETGMPYTVMPVNTGAGELVNEEFLKITPNYRIPAIIDLQARNRPFTLSEPGAILIYLAEKSGNFIPVDPADRYICLQWLMFQQSSIAPAFQQTGLNLALSADGKAAQPIDAELQRLLGVMEKRLQQDDYLAGTYSIADMAAYPWIAAGSARAGDWEPYPATRRWAEKLAARAAVERGMMLMQQKPEC